MYQLFIIALVIVPGSAFPIAMLGFSIFFVLRGAWKFVYKKDTELDSMVFFLGLVFIIAFLTVGIISGNEPEYAGKESLAYLAFLSITYCLLAEYRTSKNPITAIVTGFTIYCSLKFLLFVFISAGILSSVELYYLIKSYVPSAVVSSFSGDRTPRLVFSNDFLLPVYLFWLVCMYSLGKISSRVFISCALLALLIVMLTLSRYLYLLTLVVLFCSAVLYFRPKTVALYLVLTILMLFLAPSLVSYLGYEDLVRDRLFGTAGRNSNLIKLEQLAVLDHFYASPLFGYGFGMDLQLAGRELNNVFQSEVQWLGILAKTGVVGVCFGFSILIYILKRLTNRAPVYNRKINLIVFVVLVCWLLAGWTNPVLFLITSTISYLLLYSVRIENLRDYSHEYR